MRFTAHVQQRWSDLDAQGHVNNVTVADYLQQARSQFMAVGGDTTTNLFRDGVVVVSHSIRYHKAICHADVVDIALWVSQLGAAKLQIDYQIEVAGEPAVTASSVLCPFDFAAQRPRRLSDSERGFFANYLEDSLDIEPLTGPQLAGRGVAVQIEPRWSDVDRFGHVNNVRALDWVMEARIRTTSSLDSAMARTGTGDGSELRWLIVRQDIEYHGQLKMTDTYRVLTAPIHIGKSSVVLGTEIITDSDSVPLITAKVVLVCAEADGTKRALPESARAALKQVLIES